MTGAVVTFWVVCPVPFTVCVAGVAVGLLTTGADCVVANGVVVGVVTFGVVVGITVGVISSGFVI